jgi:hypothetical protein
MSKRNPILLSFLALLFSLFLFTPVAMATTVKVEALGFFGHPPMYQTRDTITKVCQEFGSQVDLVLHDEMASDGQKFMKDKGLSGHLPMVLYINGSVAHKIGDKVVVFRDFAGQDWSDQDLEQVIKLNIAGTQTSVTPPPNATTEDWNPSAIPQGMGPNSSNGLASSTPTGTIPGNLLGFPLYIWIIIILLVVVIAVLLAVLKKTGKRT